jgi:hypothetical protein
MCAPCSSGGHVSSPSMGVRGAETTQRRRQSKKREGRRACRAHSSRGRLHSAQRCHKALRAPRVFFQERVCASARVSSHPSGLCGTPAHRKVRLSAPHLQRLVRAQTAVTSAGQPGLKRERARWAAAAPAAHLRDNAPADGCSRSRAALTSGAFHDGSAAQRTGRASSCTTRAAAAAQRTRARRSARRAETPNGLRRFARCCCAPLALRLRVQPRLTQNSVPHGRNRRQKQQRRVQGGQKKFYGRWRPSGLRAVPTEVCA